MMIIPVPVVPLDLTTPPERDVDLSTFMPDDLSSALRELAVTVNVTEGSTPIPFVDHADHMHANFVQHWEDFVGQDKLKNLLRVYMADADARMDRFPHTLFATGMPGAGKTTLARLIAKTMEVRIRVLAPPFTAETLYDAARTMQDYEVLFIDEIHAMDRKMQDNCLHMMEEGMLYLDGQAIKVAEFTFIGATTDKDLLGEAFLSRFAISPASGAVFSTYTEDDCYKIAQNFCAPHNFNIELPDEVLRAIAKACRETPRVVRDMVVGARAVKNANGEVTPQSLLSFLDVEPDGTTREHKRYLTALYQFGRRKDGDDGFKYVMGQKTLETLLRETSQGVLRLERFLIDRGYLIKEPSGRRLTDRGIARADLYVRRGEGHSVFDN